MKFVKLDKPDRKVSLKDIPADPPEGVTKEIAEERVRVVGDELFQLQDSLWGARTHGLLVVLQGRDAAGKDGTIKHVMGSFNPRGVVVTSFGVPTPEESEHDFLWRVHHHVPRHGEVAIFNRSHYEDVLVTRVHRLVHKKVWKARYDQINAFEQMLATEGTIILKFFLHITKKEQTSRLLEREKDPAAAWKLNPDDWRDHDLWDDFTDAYEDVLSRCSTPEAPWIVVPSNAKWYRNMVVAEAILKAMKPHREIWKEKLAKKGQQGRKAIEAYHRKAERARRRKKS
jgi:PPK2 family polyphosphate:nucleotide phosphotransferase